MTNDKWNSEVPATNCHLSFFIGHLADRAGAAQGFLTIFIFGLH